MRPCFASLCLAAALAAPASAAGPHDVFRHAFNVAETTFDPAEVSDLYSFTLMANAFDAPLAYEQAKRLPDGPERNAVYREMNRLFRHPSMLGWWKCIEIDEQAAAKGRP